MYVQFTSCVYWVAKIVTFQRVFLNWRIKRIIRKRVNLKVFVKLSILKIVTLPNQCANYVSKNCFCCMNLTQRSIKVSQSSVAVHIETIHMICSSNQMTGFYIKCHTNLKWIKKTKEKKYFLGKWEMTAINEWIMFEWKNEWTTNNGNKS